MTDRERGGEDTVNAMESVVQFKGKLEAARLKELNESHGLRVGAQERQTARLVEQRDKLLADAEAVRFTLLLRIEDMHVLGPAEGEA